MTRQEILQNIKAQFKKLIFDGATTTLTTTDGLNIIVMGEDVAEGLKVEILNADNTTDKLVDGDYILSDGRTITVSGGTISGIKEVAPEEEPIVEEMATETVEPVVENTVDTDRITALENQLAELMNIIQGYMNKTEQVMSAQTELQTKVQTLSEQPSAEKITVAKKFTTEKTLSEKMKEVREIMNTK